MDPILLCTDLDRTLIPNGLPPESPNARELFCKVAAAPFVSLAYVSGRDLGLLQKAIAEYNLPTPDFMIGDVAPPFTETKTRDGNPSKNGRNLLPKTGRA